MKRIKLILILSLAAACLGLTGCNDGYGYSVGWQYRSPAPLYPYYDDGYYGPYYYGYGYAPYWGYYPSYNLSIGVYGGGGYHRGGHPWHAGPPHHRH